MLLFFLAIVAYFFGSIPFGKIVCSGASVDIQKRGSGNIGFANVLRTMGWKYALPTLLGDTAKGYIPVTLAAALSVGTLGQFIIGVMAIVGHVFSIFLKGKGGKGVATGFGILLFIEPLAALAGFVVYTLLLPFRKESSILSVLAITIVTITGIIINHDRWWMYAVLIVIASYTLRRNIHGWFTKK